MEISSSISSLSSTASLSSLSFASSTASFDLIHTWAPHRPPPKTSTPKAPAVEFWYEDEEEEPVPVTPERFGSGFLEDCRLCKRRLGAGRDAYMCAGEAAFCSEDCRLEWLEIQETCSDEKFRRRSAAMMKPCYSSRIPAAEIYSAARYRADGAIVSG